MSQGYQALLGIDTAWPVTVAYEFTSYSVGKRGTILESAGIRGRRSHGYERTRTGPYTVSGSIGMDPSPEELATLLPHVMGAAAAGTAYKLGDTFSDLYIGYHPGAQFHKYSGCRFARATFAGSEGSYLGLTLDVEGASEALPGGSFPSIVAGVTQPFVFTDAVFTFAGSARQCKAFTLVIDNVLATDQFYNSTTRQRLQAQDRIVTLSATVPYTSSETGLYEQALAGAAGTIVFTNGAYSLQFNFAKLQLPAETPPVNGRSETLLTLNMVARKSGTTAGTNDEVDIVLDSTP